MIDGTRFKKLIPNVLMILAASAISCVLTYTFIAGGFGTVESKIVKGEEAYSSIKNLVETETANYLKEKTNTITSDDIADLTYKVNKALESTNVNLTDGQLGEVKKIVEEALTNKKFASDSDVKNTSDSIANAVSDLTKSIDENDKKINDLIGSYNLRKQEVDNKVTDLVDTYNSLARDV